MSRQTCYLRRLTVQGGSDISDPRDPAELDPNRRRGGGATLFTPSDSGLTFFHIIIFHIYLFV